jgi:hypothetical protein
MDKVHTAKYSESYMPSSEPFTFSLRCYKNVYLNLPYTDEPPETTRSLSTEAGNVSDISVVFRGQYG